MNATPQPATFSELIRRKESLLRELVPISKRQLELVRLGDASLLLKFLQRKAAVMDEFEQVERLLAPMKDIPPEERIWSSEKERKETRQAIRRCQEYLETILANDALSTGELSERKDDVQEQLRRVRQSGVQRPYALQNAEETPNLRRFEVDS